MLDWLGDMGGLLDALYFIGKFLIFPFATYALRAQILSSMFRFRSSDAAILRKRPTTRRKSFFEQHFDPEDHEGEALMKQIRSDFQVVKPIDKLNFYNTYLCCRRDYKKMLLKAQSSLDKELDLRKFVYRQRLAMNSLIGLLTGRQNFFVDKLSQLIIRESSNLEETSSDQELSDWQRDNMTYAERMTKSDNKVDNRLINLYRIRKAHQTGIRLGFNNPYFDRVKNRVRCNFAEIIKDDILIPLSQKEITRRKTLAASLTKSGKLNSTPGTTAGNG